MKSKPPATTAPQPNAAGEHPHVYVSPTWRVVVHVWLVVHLIALVSPPLVAATMGGPLPRMLFDLSRPYIDLCFLNHGYAFFAPIVGENHLVEYRIWQEGEDQPQVGRFPNLETQWPRLLYHRHFMLSESLHNSFVPANVSREFYPTPEAYEEDLSRREMYERMRDSFAEHLKQQHGAERVELVRIEHRQPHPPEFEQGMSLDDKSFYRELSDDMEPPPQAPLGPLAPPPRFPFPYAPETGPATEPVP